MKKYKEPEMKIVTLDLEDVICRSGESEVIETENETFNIDEQVN